MLYLVGIFRTSNPGDSISSNPEGTAPRRQGEETDHIEVLLRTGSLDFKRLLLIEENQISQVKEIGAFLRMGRCRRLGSLKFISYASQLSWASILSFFPPSWAPLGLTIGNSCGLMATRSQIFFSFLSALRVQQHTLEGHNGWWLWHPCLLIRQEIFYFSKSNITGHK